MAPALRKTRFHKEELNSFFLDLLWGEFDSRCRQIFFSSEAPCFIHTYVHTQLNRISELRISLYAALP
jgi:hypothetical protein